MMEEIDMGSAVMAVLVGGASRNHLEMMLKTLIFAGCCPAKTKRLF